MVSITYKQKLKYAKMGMKLMKKKLTTGFQLEDFTKNKNKKIIYGHGNDKHLKIVNKNIRGKIQPRESYYNWDKSWKPSPGTELLFNQTLANAKEKYIESDGVTNKKLAYLNKTYKLKGKRHIVDSWKVPDIRLYNDNIKRNGYKSAWYVTKNIDKNSRLALIVTNKDKLNKIRKNLVGEKVKKIQIQHHKDVKGRKHSLWNFVNGG